ncbi:flagellar basal body rod protein FlgF [Agrilutibacter solisilvae]|uniref:Flagellar basal-body rod protein FlgF n=1 Tax=Agrilutibacter solisilvae TaxID=2763317 RepID=A0A974XZD2_9GAMM|nr:flagellar basal body rod protein FlgF [Lysobacter solisilvae]QSX77625.1 flagellar basal body rod protein FlgF [Lysobacter solisilvae]
MDKSLYIAMTGASATLRAQAGVAHNLANADTVGFQATLTGTVAAPVAGPGLPSRVATIGQSMGVSGAAGAITTTGNALDVALQPGHWLAVQDSAGGVAYTRAGDLRVSQNGLLTTGSGLPVLDASGAPMSIPPHDSVQIGGDGTVSIVPQGQAASTMANAGRLQIVAAQTRDLVRGEDGLMHAAPGAPAPTPASGSVLTAGVLEGSNVDGTGMLVSMIQLARQFEMQVRVLHSGDESARAANTLLSSR